MKLITPELEKIFPPLYGTESKPASQVKIIAKFFCPWGAATWFATEYDPNRRICFGYANLGDDQNAELGYFSVDELEALVGPMGLKIERDLYFGDHTLQEVIDTCGHV